eukprot:CAMPEP_0116830550 /NCGR_PEP_ID=MMETSP0418-20121206/4823_1 /TAXON_ID=1158023 /ORGANISM="Astrosyne radiata, Strain 13vi08-1A" /LENGTH=165 /DNA_ID=CAMNT_0004459661 /DNA_START=186 /DNA_END=681 /DNA_ORIENTATION=-
MPLQKPRMMSELSMIRRHSITEAIIDYNIPPSNGNYKIPEATETESTVTEKTETESTAGTECTDMESTITEMDATEASMEISQTEASRNDKEPQTGRRRRRHRHSLASLSSLLTETPLKKLQNAYAAFEESVQDEIACTRSRRKSVQSFRNSDASSFLLTNPPLD